MDVKRKQTCPWVALLGVDGSGKSSVLVNLEQTLTATAGKGLFVLHRRPHILHRAAAHGRDGLIEQHYRKPPHGATLSAVKLVIIGLDWLLGYLVYIHGRGAQGIVVVADRHSLLDMLVDPLRYRYGGPPGWVHLAIRLLPMPKTVLLLDAPTAVLQARKQELSREKTSELRHRYLELVKSYQGGVVIDATRPLSEVVADVQQIVLGKGSAADEVLYG